MGDATSAAPMPPPCLGTTSLPGLIGGLGPALARLDLSLASGLIALDREGRLRLRAHPTRGHGTGRLPLHALRVDMGGQRPWHVRAVLPHETQAYVDSRKLVQDPVPHDRVTRLARPEDVSMDEVAASASERGDVLVDAHPELTVEQDRQRR